MYFLACTYIDLHVQNPHTPRNLNRTASLPQVDHPDMPIGTGVRRDPKTGKALPGITPDSSVHDDEESELSDVKSYAGGGEGEGGGVPKFEQLPEGGRGGDRADTQLFQGDSARGGKVSEEEKNNWMPLSSRLEGAEAPNFLWEDFNMSGLPKYVIDAGKKLHHKMQNCKIGVYVYVYLKGLCMFKGEGSARRGWLCTVCHSR